MGKQDLEELTLKLTSYYKDVDFRDRDAIHWHYCRGIVGMRYCETFLHCGNGCSFYNLRNECLSKRHDYYEKNEFLKS